MISRYIVRNLSSKCAYSSYFSRRHHTAAVFELNDKRISKMSLEKNESTFKILVASDIHLGYQYDRNKGELLYDSLSTFEEILQYGKEYKVDFVLLGGDLFHDPKPSQVVLLECMNLLRKYCFGSGDIEMEFLTEPDVAFEHCRYKTVNYEDPNININMPIFTIHGNHDNPVFSSVGSIDILSVSGFVNYFGKCMDLDQVNIEPIVLKKGSTHIALYGLSYINDRRLNRLMNHYKINLKQGKDLPQDCFNILVLHQNRVHHAQNDYVPEDKLPSFLNLVIWGHEHECRIIPEVVTGQTYHISQPGSSIATSLCETEAVPKHVGLLYVNGSQFKMKKLKLNTVRPFVFDTIALYDNPELQEMKDRNPISSHTDIISAYVDSYIEDNLISKAKTQLTGHPKQPKEPLIRLRLLHKDAEDVFETTRLLQKYCDKVANPMGMILFRKVADVSSKLSKHGTMNAQLDDFSDEFQLDDDESGWTQTVQGNIKDYFDAKENKDLLTIFSVTELNEALNQYIIHGDEDAMQDVIENKMNKVADYLKGLNLEKPEDISEKIKEYRDKMKKTEEEERQDVINFLKNRSSKTRTKETYNNDADGGQIIISDSTDDDNEKSSRNESKASARGRGRGRGRASTRARNTRGAKTNLTNKSSIDSTLSSSSLLLDKEKQQTKKTGQLTLNQEKQCSSQSQLRGQTQCRFMDFSDSD